MQIDYKQAADIVRVCDNVHILTHQSPDGDTLGSAFALHFALSILGKRSLVLCPDEIPERYAFLYKNRVNNQENFEPDCVIAVDLADTGLMGNMRKIYEKKVSLCIDHHISNTMYADNTLVNPDASATCEVMYSLFSELGIKIDDNIARCLYTGIATDTGCFKYSNTTAEAHRICSELIQFDIDFASINREMFDIKSKQRFYLEQHIVDHMEYYFEGRCALLCITKDLCDKLKVDMEDLDGVASIPLQIEGTEVSVTFKEKESGVYKISMRSANSINVSHICQYLGGGGHVKAAGCIVKGTYEQARQQVLDAVGMVLGGQ
ncbi:MAG: bifunctional oligoribonuclease/PAP phosphatase NrnA [Oscillospiraceae bacterium]|nr:bifunctional oligoribonuclease/PAP phosphatase NrnA [Oscillospiraceae bacterium]